MAEERNCKTCKHGEGIFCKSDDGPCSSFVTHQHWEPKNPQPITKPKVTHTKEEWFDILDAYYCACNDREKGIDETMNNLERNGLIRKSELVELVEEAEKILNNDSDYYTPYDIGIVAKGFKALKKDHPDFGGKK
jgi:hypothetical protein